MTNVLPRIKWMLLFVYLMNTTFVYGQQAKEDPELWKRALKIHEEAIVWDAHAHKMVFGEEDREKYYPDSRQLDINMIKKGKIDGIGLYFAYYPLNNQTLFERVRIDMETFQKRIDYYTKDYNILSSALNLENGIFNQNFLILPGVEYFYGALEGMSSTIDSLYKIGIRTLTLMDNEHERLSYTIEGNPPEQSINMLGKKTIHRMNELGMLIDISHLDDRMQELVIKYSAMPVIASHSPVRAIHDVERNIPDNILKQLAQKGGAVMITFNSGDLAGVEKGRCGIEQLVDHIDHAVNVMGVDHVGLGSDFNGAGLRSPAGLEDASGFPLITYHLLKRGYTEGDVKKIMGGNYVSVLKTVLSGKRTPCETSL